jgi:hypothetical protein
MRSSNSFDQSLDSNPRSREVVRKRLESATEFLEFEINSLANSLGLTDMSTSIRNQLSGAIEKIVSDKVVSEIVIRAAA